MTEPIIPEWFGCGNKLSHKELLSLDAGTLSGTQKTISADAGVMEFDNYLHISSIDKIYQVGASPAVFAELSIRHAISDLAVSGCNAIGIDICFEFSHQSTKEGRLRLSQAVFKVAASMGLLIGKCHSNFGRSTALTIACFGKVNKTHFNKKYELEDKGLVVISGGLGGLCELYMSALQGNRNRGRDFFELVSNIDRKQTANICAKFGVCTDISGNALFGSALVLAEQYNKILKIETKKIPTIVTASSMTIPPCLYSNGLPEKFDPKPSNPYEALCIVRELCGPILFLINQRDEHELKTGLANSGWSQPQTIGQFNSSKNQSPSVNLS